MEPPSRKVTLTNETGRRITAAPLRRAVSATLERFHPSDGLVSILITDDEGIQALNRDYRNLDEATDVLTFPAGDYPGEPKPLGDIAISLDTAIRQAKARSIPVSRELAYLTIHGALHLAGMDDQTDSERDGMLVAMNEVAETLGMPRDEAWGSLHEEPVR